MKKYFVFFLLLINFFNVLLFAQNPPFNGNGDGTVGNPFQLWTKDHLIELYDSSYSDRFKGVSLYWHLYKHFRFMQDIEDVSQGIGYISFRDAHFYGNWKKLTANTANMETALLGLTNSTLDSLIVDGHIKYSLASLASRYAMPPLPPPIVSHCINNATVTTDSAFLAYEWHHYPAAGIANSNSGIISHCINNGSVSGVDRIGGVAAGNNGEIISCINTGKITASNSGTNTNIVGQPTPNNGVGGIAATTNNTALGILNSINIGSVEGQGFVGGIMGCIIGASIVNSINSGYIKGERAVGGIVGYMFNFDVNISNCLNTGVIEGDEDVGAIVGKEP